MITKRKGSEMKVEVKKPCEWACPKCGDADIHRCVKCHGRIKLCFDCGVEANREKPFICHSCRKSEKPAEKPVEKTYTREDVAKVLCPYCRNEHIRVCDTVRGFYHSQTGAPCYANDWLKATEKKGE